MRISDWSSDVCSSDLLWQFNAGLGILGGPMSFSSGGKQYVSVLVGYGGSAAVTSDMLNVGWKFNAQPRRLLTFELGGKARLAPSPPRDLPVPPLASPSIAIGEGDRAPGRSA